MCDTDDIRGKVCKKQYLRPAKTSRRQSDRDPSQLSCKSEFIRSIQRYQITLVDGTELPVPQRKYNELRQKLMKLYMIEEN